jgi:hypothetical protein
MVHAIMAMVFEKSEGPHFYIKSFGEDSLLCFFPKVGFCIKFPLDVKISNLMKGLDKTINSF